MPKNLDLTENLEKYIINNSEDLHPAQKELIEKNNKLGEVKRMQISISQAHFFQILIKTAKIKTILEIGTFTGFSALSMGLALPKNSELITLDKDEKTSLVAQAFFKKANLSNVIKQIVKPALETLKDLKKDKKIFDLIFIDADKENYKKYYENSLELLKKNGLLIIDNVLWRGNVADMLKKDKFTDILRNFNSYVKNDNRVEKIILPLGDGLNICVKK
jgi:predicted O-methyltransferase YrrM